MLHAPVQLPGATLLTATGGIAQTNAFALIDDAARQAVLIDAPDHTVGVLLDELDRRGVRLNALWLTHGHFDHIADHAEVRRRHPRALVVMHALDAPKLAEPGVQTRMFQLPFVIPPGTPDHLVDDGDVGTIGSLSAVAMHTPGHAPGHVAFYFEGLGLLFGGDLIIGGSVGRTDLPDSEPGVFAASIARVMALPDATVLCGGHGRTTTIGHERTRNASVRALLAR